VSLLLVVLPLAGFAYQLRPRPISIVVHDPPVVFNPCRTQTAARLLLVSVARQRLWVCDGHQLVRQTAVTTGTTVVRNGVDDATPLGSWQIQAKYQDVHLRGRDANGPWDDYVQYWLPFDGSVGFHDASWQSFPFGGRQYHSDGSHGCVHLPTLMAGWLYAWASVGTTVTIEA
jgi:lipoprotein-anchoring transpeptidase ErfK/SrfK